MMYLIIHIPMGVIVALFLTIRSELPDSSASSTKRQVTPFPIYRSSSLNPTVRRALFGERCKNTKKSANSLSLRRKFAKIVILKSFCRVKNAIKTLRNVKKKRFRRVLRSLPVVSVFLNHPESYTAFIAVFALVGYLYDKSLAIFLAILEIMPTFAQIM